MELVIKRSEWIHTKKDLNSPSKLYRSRDGKKCCLGFYGSACGISSDAMRDLGAFWVRGVCTIMDERGVYTEGLPGEMQWLVQGNGEPSDDAAYAMRANDNPFLTADEKESKIASVFAAHNVNVTFVD